jgi:surface protein
VFRDASAFYSDLSSWNVSKVVNMQSSEYAAEMFGCLCVCAMMRVEIACEICGA